VAEFDLAVAGFDLRRLPDRRSGTSGL